MYRYGYVEGSKHEIMEELHAMADESKDVYMNNSNQNESNNNISKSNRI